MLSKIKLPFSERSYKIIEHEDYVEIYHVINGYTEIENYIMLKKFKDSYQLFRVNRNNEFLVAKSNDRNYAVCCMIIFCKKYYYHSFIENSIHDKLDKYVQNKEYDKAYDVIEDVVESRYFLINGEDYYKVNLNFNDNTSNVKYQDIYIARNVSFIRGYGVMLNYAKMLMEFELEFQTLSLKYDIKDKYDELARLYLFGQTMGPYYFP